jgi:hypothetical protein
VARDQLRRDAAATLDGQCAEQDQQFRWRGGECDDSPCTGDR